MSPNLLRCMSLFLAQRGRGDLHRSVAAFGRKRKSNSHCRSRCGLHYSVHVRFRLLNIQRRGALSLEALPRSRQNGPAGTDAIRWQYAIHDAGLLLKRWREHAAPIDGANLTVPDRQPRLRRDQTVEVRLANVASSNMKRHSPSASLRMTSADEPTIATTPSGPVSFQSERTSAVSPC
jgi:hypothetical protein